MIMFYFFRSCWIVVYIGNIVGGFFIIVLGFIMFWIFGDLFYYWNLKLNDIILNRIFLY